MRFLTVFCATMRPPDLAILTFKEKKVMGDRGGKKDKGKKEQQKQAKQTLKEKRRSKKEKML